MTSYIYSYYKTICKTTSKSKSSFEIFLYWNSSCILGKIKLDSLLHLMMRYLLGYMIIDHITLTTTRNVIFLLLALLMMIVLCLEYCSFYTQDWYEEVLSSISVIWGHSGMTSEVDFNVYLCPWKVFHLKIVEVILFLLCLLPLVFHFNLILVNIFLLLYGIVF